MNPNKKYILILWILGGVLLLTSCKKNSETDYSTQNKVAEEINFNDVIIDDLFEMVLICGYDTNLHREGFKRYKEVIGLHYTVDDEQIEIEIEYPNWEHWFSDGIVRSGLIKVDLTKPLYETGSVATFTFINFAFAFHELDAELSIINQGEENYNLSIQQAVLLAPDTLTQISGRFNSIKTFTVGNITMDASEFNNMLVQHTGTMSGTATNGKTYSCEVVSPLTRSLNCFYFESGTNQLTIPGIEHNTGTINYLPEDGCSNKLYKVFNEIGFTGLIKN